MNRDRSLFLAGLLGASAVALGAFGAHGLKGHTDAAGLATWHTAAHYHLIHAVALAALSGERSPLPGRLIVAGVLLFSGSLYALVLSGQRWLGAVTPLGGLCFIAAWSLVAWAHRPGRPPWSA